MHIIIKSTIKRYVFPTLYTASSTVSNTKFYRLLRIIKCCHFIKHHCKLNSGIYFFLVNAVFLPLSKYSQISALLYMPNLEEQEHSYVKKNKSQ